MERIFILLMAGIPFLPLYAKLPTPDFTMPETEMKNAENQIEKAIKTQDNRMLIDGMIRLSLAKTRITSDNLPQSIIHLDSIATSTTDTSARSVMHLLEIDMLADMVENDGFRFANRLQARGERPQDMREWSREDFVDRIIELTQELISHSDELKAIPITEYKEIVIMPKVLPEFTPSLYDMIAHHAAARINDVATTSEISILRYCSWSNFLISRPKVDDKAAQCLVDIYASLLERRDPASPAFIYSETQRLSSNLYSQSNSETAVDSLINYYNEISDSPYSIEIINHLIDINADPLLLEPIAREALAKHPDYANLAKTKNFIAECDQTKIEVVIPGAINANTPIPMQIKRKNANSVKIKCYRLPQFVHTGDLDNCAFVEAITTEADSLTFPPLPAGKYAFIAETTTPKGKRVKHSQEAWVRVSDIEIMTVLKINGEQRIYVTDAITGKPLADTKVIFYKRRQNNECERLTNSDGYCVLPAGFNDCSAYAVRGNHRSEEINIYRGYNYHYNNVANCQVRSFIDRGVYRPGEVMKFAIVAGAISNDNISVVKQQSFTATLYNANHEKIDSLQLTTDNFGRANGSFTIPGNGLTGSYRLSISNMGYNRTTKYFEVSEYKAPNFFTEINDDDCNLESLANVKITGRVATFSEFPLAGAKVKYHISGINSWWNRAEFDNHSGEITTDDRGHFSIDVPADCFSTTKGKMLLNIHLDVTDDKGETQPYEHIVSVGKIDCLPPLANYTVDADRPLELPSSFKDLDCVDWQIFDDNSCVAEGQITPDSLSIDLSQLASGVYRLQLTLPDNSDSVSSHLQLYRHSDKALCFEAPLIVMDDEVTANADNTFEITYGNSFDNYAYYIITCGDKVTSEGWLHSEKGVHKFFSKAEFSRLLQSEITLIWMDNHRTMSKTVTLLPAVAPDKITIECVSFRDNIVPGSREKWQLRIRNNNGKRYTSAVIANMYDAALDNIADNEWTFNMTIPHISAFSMSNSAYLSFVNTSAISKLNYASSPTFTPPYLNYYGLSFYQMNYDLLYECCMPTQSMRKANDLDIDDSVAEEDIAGESASEGENDNNGILRDESVKSAFFMPTLVSTEEGDVVIDFEVPDRNTKWHFTALAYTDDMQYDIIDRLVTASKPLMIQPNLPRFVREGDKLSLSAMAMNNSDSRQVVDVQFTIVNGNDTITRSFKAIEINAGEKKTVKMDCDIATGTEIVSTVKIMLNGIAVDGQRDMIAILPATTDVVEASPFYLNENSQKATIPMPTFNSKGLITFEYADNPAWYAATALPSIVSDNATASAQAYNYFATRVAECIVGNNPDIAEALKTMKMRSPLHDNADLKIISLDNTIWHRSADNETEVMNTLCKLTDNATIDYRKKKATTSLYELQNNDGGFSWFKGCDSSLWTTIDVLHTLGYINEMGYAEKSNSMVNDMVMKAINYCDEYFVTEYLNHPKHRPSLIAKAEGYVRIRAMHQVPKMNKTMKEIADTATLNMIDRRQQCSPVEKADIAIYLATIGKTKEAEIFVESLRQTAVKNELRGMYWDVDFADKTAIVAKALKAFHRLDPDDKAINDMRRFLLLSKETQCWGSTINAVHAVNALLNTGDNWAKKSRRSPSITISGKPLDTNDASPYYGYLRRTLDIDRSEGVITINRESGTPAWGGVYCQYSAPMDSINAHSAGDIRIEKQFFVYDNDGKLLPKARKQFNVGERIHVRLTIRSERDLDFVAMTDDRAAGFEPVQQTAGYDWQDGVVIYKENRDSSTQFFISRLPKGSFVLSYDVYANNAGSFASGIASLQCQYSPKITAHSEGTVITIRQ